MYFICIIVPGHQERNQVVDRRASLLAAGLDLSPG